MEVFIIVMIIVLGVHCVLEIISYLITGESWLDVFDDLSGRPK